jgi:SAM-dependent methyltransferase
MTKTINYEERKESDIKTDEAGKQAVKMFYEVNSQDPTKINEFYNTMGADGYDQWAKVVNFTEPFEIINQVSHSREEGGLEMPKDTALLDVGAGTGIIGNNLAKLGYHNLEALDASEGFAARLSASGTYSDVHCMFLGMGADVFPFHLRSKYDVITASGTFMPNHMPASAIDDIHSALKVGGVLVTAMRGSIWEQGNELGYRDKFDQMVADGKFELVKTWTFMRGTTDGSGLYAQMESVGLVIRRIV